MFSAFLDENCIQRLVVPLVFSYQRPTPIRRILKITNHSPQILIFAGKLVAPWNAKPPGRSMDDFFSLDQSEAIRIPIKTPIRLPTNPRFCAPGIGVLNGIRTASDLSRAKMHPQSQVFRVFAKFTNLHIRGFFFFCVTNVTHQSVTSSQMGVAHKSVSETTQNLEQRGYWSSHPQVSLRDSRAQRLNGSRHTYFDQDASYVVGGTAEVPSALDAAQQ